MKAGGFQIKIKVENLKTEFGEKKWGEK